MDHPFERPATPEERLILSRGWGGKLDVYWLSVLLGLTGGLLAGGVVFAGFRALGLTHPAWNGIAGVLGMLGGVAWIWWEHRKERVIFDRVSERGRQAFEAGRVWEWRLEVTRCWEVDIMHDTSPGYILQGADGRAFYVQCQGFFDGYPDELEVPLRQVRVVWEPGSRRIIEIDMSGEPVEVEEELAAELYDDHDELMRVAVLDAQDVERLVQLHRQVRRSEVGLQEA